VNGDTFYIQTRGIGSSTWSIYEPNSPSESNIFISSGSSQNPALFSSNLSYQLTYFTSGNSWDATSISYPTWKLTQIGTSGVYNNNALPLPTVMNVLALYTTNFTSSTNTSYNPELNLPTDIATGSQFYISDAFNALNSCPTYLKNHNTTSVVFYSGGSSHTNVYMNAQNLSIHYVSTPLFSYGFALIPI